MVRSELEKLRAGQFYRGGDPEIEAELAECREWLVRYNDAFDHPHEERLVLLRGRLAAVGDNTVVRSPFFCDLGTNIHLGADVFLNVNCLILDMGRVSIGAGTQIGPGVHIYAADHPRDPDQRRQGLQSAKPVTIGRNVWIGGGAIILPGIVIGDDAIIGAGSVVTKPVKNGETVIGNPARPMVSPARRGSALA